MTGTMPIPARQDLEVVLTRCSTGSEEAFAELYDRSIAFSLRLAWGFARERVGAERILLDSYVDVWRTSAQFDPAAGSALGWILSAVRRRGLAPAG